LVRVDPPSSRYVSRRELSGNQRWVAAYQSANFALLVRAQGQPASSGRQHVLGQLKRVGCELPLAARWVLRFGRTILQR
jgi:hypothetical protein